jgi:TonB family protein
MTLVESLTQRLPVWERIREEEPSLPDSMPAPWGDLARHCLRRDPARRWTLADITRWLNPAAAGMPGAPRETSPPRHAENTFAKRGYLLPVAAMALILVAMLAGPKLFTHHLEAQPAADAASTDPKAKPKPETPPSEPSAEPKRAAPRSSEAPPATAAATVLKTEKPASAVESGARKGGVLEQALPEISEKARDSVQGTVRVSVRVEVDPAGHVVRAALEIPGPSKFFADQALAAAPRWKFSPPTVGGQNVASEWMLRFDFSNTDTKVHPSEITP